MSYVSIFNLFPTATDFTYSKTSSNKHCKKKGGGRLFGKKGINVSVLLALYADKEKNILTHNA